jgi:hypothetical protein
MRKHMVFIPYMKASPFNLHQVSNLLLDALCSLVDSVLDDPSPLQTIAVILCIDAFDESGIDSYKALSVSSSSIRRKKGI